MPSSVCPGPGRHTPEPRAEAHVGRRVDRLLDVQPLDRAVGEQHLGALLLDLGAGAAGADALGRAALLAVTCTSGSIPRAIT